MEGGWFRRQRLLLLAISVAVVVFVVLSFSLYGVVTDAVRGQVSGQTRAAASTTAVGIANAIQEDARLAQAVVGGSGTAALSAGTASRVVANALEYANINIQRANPQVTGFYFYDHSGAFTLAQTVDPSHRAQGGLSIQCDSTNTYCTDANAPTRGYLAAVSMRDRLIRAMRSARMGVVLAFDRTGGPFGDLYIMQPIAASADGAPGGAMVERVDAATVFAPYVLGAGQNTLILSGDVVIDRNIGSYHGHGQLPVAAAVASVDPALRGGLSPVQIGGVPRSANSQFSLDGTTVVASLAPTGQGDLQVVSYADANVLSASSTSLIATALPFLLLLGLCVAGPLYYRNRQMQRREREYAQGLQARAEALARDIVAVSQALEEPRGRERTAQVSNDPGVRQLSESLNALLGGITANISGASRSVLEGAARVDGEVRRLLGMATNQSALVTEMAISIVSMVRSAEALQHASAQASTQARSAGEAVASGQRAVEQIGEVVEAIKDAAIGARREFRHLRTDSARLTALVGAVRVTAESLEQLAASAAVEAQSLGGGQGAALVRNLDRAAKQAQDTLGNADTAVRGVIASIETVDQRLERISEWVRHGVDDLSPVRGSFEHIAQTNDSLRGYIAGVDDAAGGQLQSAQLAASAIGAIEGTFQEFKRLAVASDTEISIMRAIVANLERTVANLGGDAIRLMPSRASELILQPGSADAPGLSPG